MISVVIPAFNEAAAIDRTIGEVRLALDGIEHEIIVVDDGGTDGTAAKASAAGARVITHIHNLGYGAALKSGIGAATYDTIAITDADGTYPNEELPRLLKEYHRGFDMVVGARTGEHYRESAVKAPLRTLLKWLVEFTAGRHVADVNSGLRIFSKAEVTPYFDHLCNTFSFTTSVTLVYMMTAKFVAYVPIAYKLRVGQTKVRLFRDSLRTLQYIVQNILYYNPLKLFLLISGVMGLAGLAAWSAALVTWRVEIAFMAGVWCFLTAVLVFCFGLVAELLSRILRKSNVRLTQ